jgi:ElaB/YqjD/DUF883 family membrane-anchored ribosome-binding protein
MATSTNESLSELERRSERTRAELAQTVDALHSRVSPSAIKADVKSYVRDNPLQAAAIAVGAAYPVWRMIGAMPAPVLLIGAGLAMARRGSSSASYGNGYANRTGNGTGYSTGNGNGVMSTLKEKASDITSQIAGKAQETVENVRNMASDTATRTTDTLSNTLESGKQVASDTMQQVSDRAGETYARATESLSDMIERHPLLVGGVAFAVGSIIASAVPVSRQENRIMGETAEEVRRRSQDLAMQGLRQAQDVAQQVYQSAADEVRQEGLTPETARKTARAAVESARGAMENTTGGTNRS